MTDGATLPETAPIIIAVPPTNAISQRGMISGGWILSQVDDAAGLAGYKFSGADAFIVKIVDLTFLASLDASHSFRIYAAPIRFGSSSFSLSLTAWLETDHGPRQILTSEILMVAVDDAGKPRPIAENLKNIANNT